MNNPPDSQTADTVNSVHASEDSTTAAQDDVAHGCNALSLLEIDEVGDTDASKLMVFPYRCRAASFKAITIAAEARGLTRSQLIATALAVFGVPVLTADIEDRRVRRPR